MSKALATEDAVVATVKALERRGVKTTIEAVLAVTGGSKSTIAPILRKIRREKDSVDYKELDIPDDLRLYVERGMMFIWAALQERTTETMAAKQAEMNVAVSALSNQLMAVERDSSVSKAMLSSRDSEILDLRNEAAALSAEIERLKEVIAQYERDTGKDLPMGELALSKRQLPPFVKPIKLSPDQPSEMYADPRQMHLEDLLESRGASKPGSGG